MYVCMYVNKWMDKQMDRLRTLKSPAGVALQSHDNPHKIWNWQLHFTPSKLTSE